MGGGGGRSLELSGKLKIRVQLILSISFILNFLFYRSVVKCTLCFHGLCRTDAVVPDQISRA